MNIGWLLFSFQGRISRQPYWIFTGSVILLGLLLFVVLGSGEAAEIIVTVITLLLLWPSVAVQAKRWHDRDKSGWWILINFVPVIGPLWALIENGFLSGTVGTNRFGSNANFATNVAGHETYQPMKKMRGFLKGINTSVRRDKDRV